VFDGYLLARLFVIAIKLYTLHYGNKTLAKL